MNIRAVRPEQRHLDYIWTHMAQDDVFELMNGATPPKSSADLWTWGEEFCAFAVVVLVDERPVAFCGVSDHGYDFLVPWGITVRNPGLSRRQALSVALQVWDFMREATPGRPYANLSTTNHKRSRAILPWLGFRFTGKTWTSPTGAEFEWFTYGDVDV